MKYLFILFIVLSAIFNGYSNNPPYTDKNKPYPVKDLGVYGEHIIKVKTFLLKNIDSAFYYLDQAEAVLDTNSDLEKVIYCDFKSVAYFNANFIDSGVFVAETGLEIAERNQFLHYQNRFHGILGSYSKDKEEGLAHSLKALDLALEIGEDRGVFAALNSLMVFEVQNNRPEKALDYLERMRVVLGKMKPRDSILYMKYYFWVAELSKDYQIAINYMDSAILECKMNNRDMAIVGLVYYTGVIHSRFDGYEAAIKEFQKAEKMSVDMGIPEASNRYDSYQVAVYTEAKNCEKAKYYFERLEGSVYVNSISKAELYKAGYNVYKLCGKNEKAIDYLEKFLEDSDEQNGQLRDSLEVEYANKYHLNEIKTENLLKTKEVEYQTYRNRLTLIISLCIIACIVLVFLFRVKIHRKNLKLSKELFQKEKENSEFRKKSIENITHEIKTPLTQIHGVLEFIQDKTLDKELLNLVKIGSKNSTQLKHEIDHILQLMKSESYSDSVHKTKTNLKELFSELIEDHTLKAFGKGLSIHIKHNLTTESFAYIDQEKVSMIFLNFLTNGIKFSRDINYINITIQASKGQLKFEVENFGSYISEEDQVRIFDRYYQVDDHNSIGHGIGLSIVKELSEVLGAEVGVDSILKDKVTRFYCVIPAKVFKISNTTITKTIEFKHSLKKKEDVGAELSKILVVDDNALMIEFYNEILSTHFDCDFSLNGEDALKKVKENHYDCIVSDILMPNMNGFELVDKIMEIEEVKLLPVVFVTGNQEENTKQDALNIGVHDVISKPFIIKELIARINNVINNNILRKEIVNRDIVDSETGKQNEVVVEGENSKDANEELLKRILHYIDINIKNTDFEIAELATCVFYSSRQLNRKTVELTGLTPGKLILERRLLKAYALLKGSESIRITEVQEEVGIKSSGYFYTKFKKRFGVSPSSVKKNELF